MHETEKLKNHFTEEWDEKQKAWGRAGRQTSNKGETPEINDIAQIMANKSEDVDLIRDSARLMFDRAVQGYTGYLLKSALNMIYGVLQFANDLENPLFEEEDQS